MFDLGLKDKIALITGSTRGLGKAIAEKLAEEKVKVIITGTNEGKAKEVAESIAKTYGVETAGFKLDVVDESAVKEVVTAIAKQFGSIDILINNAGITRDARLMMMKAEDWEAVLRTNLTGAFNCTKFVSKRMLQQKSGKIINITSVVGIMGNVGQANYSASKAGLIGLTKTTAKELAERGVTANAIAPGYIQSDMTEVLSEDISKKMLSSIPLGFYGKPEDVANAVLFLVSDKARYITGQILKVDGGMIM
ncbi:MAG: 3-oxoacyl-ACP synthase [Firmicutes bacterium]|nr:3-oxoacyl-ACP synthase [Bacillota bacterium]